MNTTGSEIDRSFHFYYVISFIIYEYMITSASRIALFNLYCYGHSGKLGESLTYWKLNSLYCRCACSVLGDRCSVLGARCSVLGQCLNVHIFHYHAEKVQLTIITHVRVLPK